ncbi:MAG: periplasmic heavy metal sensor [Alphaproteobacteria bacterium]
MSDEEGFGAPRKRGRWRQGWTWKRIAIVASVALNLFFIGLVGAWQGRAWFAGPPPGPTIPRMLEGTLRNLPEDDRLLLQHTFEQRRMEIAKLAEGLRRTRSAMSRSLRQADFDPADFDAKAMEARQARSRLDAALHRVYRDAAAGMTPEGRNKLGGSRRPG